MIDHIPSYTLDNIKKFHGKNLAQCYFEIITIAMNESWSVTDKKMEMIRLIKESVGREYNINQINKWFAGSEPIPSTKSAPVQQYMRKFVLAFLFGDEVAELMDFI